MIDVIRKIEYTASTSSEYTSMMVEIDSFLAEHTEHSKIEDAQNLKCTIIYPTENITI